MMLRKILKDYLKSFSYLLGHWKMLALLFLANLIFAFIAVGPLNWLIEKGFGHSLDLDNFLDGFNYTLVMDFLNEYGVTFNAFINHSVLILFSYILWLVFINGGISRSLVEERRNWSISKFWSFCGRYFSKFLGLQLYVFIVYGLIIFIFFRIFMKDGISPFNFTTEQILIDRFWLLIVLFFILSFFINVYKDTTKQLITQSEVGRLHRSLRDALGCFLNKEIIFPVLLHLLGIAIISLVYFALRRTLDNVSILIIIIGQIYLMLRISYRILRLSVIQIALSDKIQNINHSMM